ncbi:MAG: transcriptional regulator/antitoxin MazE [Litoreibacter sp.]
MFETKIRKVGNSAVVTLSSEVLAAMDVREGDSVYLARSDDGGMRLMAYDPELANVLKVAEEVMDDNRDLLQALA